MLDPLQYLNNPLQYLNSQIQYITRQPVRMLCQDVIDRKAFQTGYGSASNENKHHNYPGGLLQHTAEVMSLALNAAGSNVFHVDMDVLRTAVVFHDIGIGKIRDYNPDDTPTDFKSKIYHVADGYAFWVHVAQMRVSQEFIDAVGHCLLAHHERREWKSWVEPQTIEAYLLHHADVLSAQFGKV